MRRHLLPCSTLIWRKMRRVRFARLRRLRLNLPAFLFPEFLQHRMIAYLSGLLPTSPPLRLTDSIRLTRFHCPLEMENPSLPTRHPPCSPHLTSPLFPLRPASL